MSAEQISGTNADSVTITRDDLEVVAEAMMLRFQLRGSESRRVARMREQLAAASELCRTISTHTHHALVHCQGSHGTGDLMADTAALYDALAGYGEILGQVAEEYRAIVRETVEPFEPSAASTAGSSTSAASASAVAGAMAAGGGRSGIMPLRGARERPELRLG